MIVRYLNLLALIATVAWVTATQTWESMAAMLLLFAGIVALDVQMVRANRRASGTAATISADMSLYTAFITVLPSSGSISFIDTCNMAGYSFDWKRLRDLEVFYHEWNDAEHEFHNRELESLRKQLHELVVSYLDYLGMNSFPTEAGFQTIPPEWEETQPDRFWQTVKTVHDYAGQIVARHQEFIRRARSILKL